MNQFIDSNILIALKRLNEIENKYSETHTIIDVKMALYGKELNDYNTFDNRILERYTQLYHYCADDIATDDQLEEYLLLKKNRGYCVEPRYSSKYGNGNFYKKLKDSMIRGSTNEEANEVRSTFKILK
jgi:hypothetical protein